MGRVIVIEFVSLDGVVQDPDGSEGSAQGGWVFRYGPQAVTGDKFGVGEVLDTGALLLGRRTWQMFAKIWPGRSDEFSARMNAVPKLVASRSPDQATDWENSAVLPGDLVAEVRERKRAQDIVITGSLSVVRTLMAHDLVDEYRLMVFPLVLGAGSRLFPDGAAPVELRSPRSRASNARERCRLTRTGGWRQERRWSPSWAAWARPATAATPSW
jgi:dihydrofolate reductase